LFIELAPTKLYVSQQFLKKVTVAQAAKQQQQQQQQGSADATASGSNSSSPMKLSDLQQSGGNLFDDDEQDSAHDHADRDGEGDHEHDKKHTKRSQNVVIHGYQLAALFRRRPELAEFVYLEIQNMKQDPNSKQFAMEVY
jgi:ABC-type Zn2+ transport system substrate-binding protein/surface adhesin